ncbi:unnamed protein product, partial [Allacma fusca]
MAFESRFPGLPVDSDRTCLLCSQVFMTGITLLESNGKESKELLNQLARLLGVSSSIYCDLDIESLPEPLVCSSCRRTVSSALVLQETLLSVKDQLRSLIQIIMKEFIRSYEADSNGPANSYDYTGNTMKRIRKTYVQCFAPCEVRLTAVEAQPDIMLPESSAYKIILPPVSDLQESEIIVKVQSENEFEFRHLEFEGDNTWEGKYSMEIPLLVDAPLVEHIMEVEVETTPPSESSGSPCGSPQTSKSLSRSPSRVMKSEDTNTTFSEILGISNESSCEDDLISYDDNSDYKPSSICYESPVHSPSKLAGGGSIVFEHTWTYIKEKKTFLVNLAGPDFLCMLTLGRTLVLHNGIDKLRCQPCEKKFKTTDEYLHHVKWHAAGCPPEKESPAESQYRCPICKQGYDFKHAFDYHMEKHDKPDELVSRYIKAVRNDERDVISFTCDVCKEEFSQASHLNNESQFQIVCHHGNCHCNETFTHLQKFMHHHSKVCTLAYRRTLPQQRLCEECGKDFSNEQYLMKHIRRCHPKTERYSCEECGKIFGQKNLLDTHFATHHSTETPHQCHICGKGFKTKYSVNGHLRKIHGYECNYACEKCGKKFKTQNYLVSHLQSHDDDAEKCHICGKVFKSRAHVWHHVYNTHERRRPPRKKKSKAKESTVGSNKSDRHGKRRSPKKSRQPVKENMDVIKEEIHDVKLI